VRQVEVAHEYPLGRLPAEYRKWRYLLGPRAWRLYTALRDERFDGAVVDLGVLARRLGMSYSALQQALRQLEANGCVTVEEDEG
jgi:DNA-binding MarR family transcriptional regulator